MDRFVRAIVALILLISQMSRVVAACGCPEVAPQTKPTATASAPCPMSGQIGCQCCAGETKSDSALPPLTSKLSVCEVVLTGPSSAPQCHAVSIGSLVAMALPSKVFEFHWVLSLPDVAHPRLLLQRIRPPNGWIYGLRAPPAF